MKILVTGATGAIGQAVCQELSHQGHDVFGTRRQQFEKSILQREGYQAIQWLKVSDINADTDWTAVLSQIDIVIHLAARAHVLKETAPDPLSQFRSINTHGTLNLARQSAAAGVRRFIFVSSIGVNGNCTKGQAFTESDIPQPHDAYSISKYEAEQGLQEICSGAAMEYVIVRPPLVYGPSVKGNFASLIKWIRSGVPLPLGAVDNKRSLIALGNLVDFLVCCADLTKSSGAANEVFVISDDDAVSTAELLRKVAHAYGVQSRLLFIPTSLLWLGAIVTGQRRAASRLLASLEIDSSKARRILGWRPIMTMEEQLKEMANDVTHI